MNLRQIEVFRTFMVAGTVSGAARMLGVAQPGVSKLLRHLEDRLGVILFERVRGRLLPTPEARALFAEIDAIWDRVDRLQGIARDLAGGLPGPLRIVVSPSLATHVLPRAVARLAESRAGLRVSVEVQPGAILVAALEEGRADLGLAFGPLDHPAIVTRVLGHGAMVCVLPAGHRLAGRRSLRATDLAGTPVVNCRAEVATTPAGEDPTPELRNPVVEVRSAQAACWFVRSGAGIAVVDEFAVRGGAIPGIAVIPFEPATEVYVVLASNRYRPMPAVGRALADTVRDVLKEGSAQLRPATKFRL